MAGLRATVACAVVCNVLAGLLARQIRRNAELPAAASEIFAADSTNRAAPSPGILPFLLTMFGVVGASAFAYEIAWTRLLAISISSSTYAFTLMLATFLIGTVLGSALFDRFFATMHRASMTTFSRTQTWIGAAAILSLILFRWIPGIVPPMLRLTQQSFAGLVLAQFAVAALTVLPVAMIFGFNFPAVIVLLSEGSGGTAGRAAAIGKAYAANTCGAILGSLLTGFWLVPRLGPFRVVAVTAAVNLLLAAVLEVRLEPRRLAPIGFNVLFAAFAMFVATSSFFYNPSLLSLSAVLYGSSYRGLLNLQEVADTNALVFAADGVNDSIGVFRSDNYVALRVNGKVDASTGDARTQLLLGHLGAVFDPAPRRVLIIGFGSGMTASAVSRYPSVQRIDCVEIEPAVIRAAPYLTSLNRNVLADPRVHVVYDDARNFLMTSREKYDLIVSEPSNPWIAGIATLFTDEYYAAVRARLAPGGKFVQWVQSYALAPEDLKMIFATLAPHFPEVTLWRAEGPDLLLLARTDARPLQFERLRSLWSNQALRDDFNAMDVQQPAGLVAYFLLDDPQVRELGHGAERNTDDRTLLEYDAPKTVLHPDLSRTNHELIAQFRTGPLPANLDPNETARALEAGAATALDLGDVPNAKSFLQSMAKQRPTATFLQLGGRVALAEGRLQQAEEDLRAAVVQNSEDPEAQHWLAVVEQKLGNTAAARTMVDQILAKHPRYLPALTDEMEFAAERQDFHIALLAQLNRMTVIPEPAAPEYCRLAAIWMKLGELREAEPVLQIGLRKDPYSYACNLEYAEVERESNHFAEARRRLEMVIRMYPDYDATTFRTLAGVDLILGDRRAARATLQKGLRFFPDDPELRQAVAGKAEK
jgi:predicted membrane-bound spermidine synthase/Tfp pilus assembly protein PilF